MNDANPCNLPEEQKLGWKVALSEGDTCYVQAADEAAAISLAIEVTGGNQDSWYEDDNEPSAERVPQLDGGVLTMGRLIEHNLEDLDIFAEYQPSQVWSAMHEPETGIYLTQYL